MRMWMLNPKMLCDKHLLGEHGELHKFIPTFRKKYRINKRIYPVVQIELSSFKERHDALANEMLNRGFNHQSPIETPDFSYLPEDQYNAKVDTNISMTDLISRCDKCRVKNSAF